MSRADNRPEQDERPARRRIEAVIAQYIRELAAQASDSSR